MKMFHGKTVGHSFCIKESLLWTEPLLRSSCRLHTANMIIFLVQYGVLFPVP